MKGQTKAKQLLTRRAVIKSRVKQELSVPSTAIVNPTVLDVQHKTFDDVEPNVFVGGMLVGCWMMFNRASNNAIHQMLNILTTNFETFRA